MSGARPGGPRIVFVVPYGYPALAGGAGAFGYVGGAEMQQARLARMLAERGHDVWMITADFGQAQRVEIDGVYAPDQWRPGEIIEDRYDVALPENLAPGAYDVRVKLVRTPHYPNTRLRDYLHDDDEFSGPIVGRLTVTGGAR